MSAAVLTLARPEPATREELIAAAHEKIAEGHAMLATAHRMPTESSADPLVPVDVIAAELGVKPRVITDAAGRDEIELGYAGRKPVVRRSEIERWVASRRREPKTAEHLSPREAARRAVAERAVRSA